MRPLLAFLVLSLAACGPSSSSGSGGRSGAGPGGALPDTGMVQGVAVPTTEALVAGDLAVVSPSVAIQTIDLWVARLDTVSAEGAGDVRDDLDTLRNLLQSSPIDGSAVGKTLRRLGEGTAALAAGPDTTAAPVGRGGEELGRLARTLQMAGERLAPDTTGTSGTELDR